MLNWQNCLQKMVDQGLISHASGDRRKPYIYGFYLYFIVQSDKDKRGKVQCTACFGWA